MSLVRRTARRFNSSVSTNITSMQARVRLNAACTEKKKWKLAICVLKSEAVKNVMSWESPTPSTMPATKATTETITVSERHDRGDAPAPHAEHLVQAKLLFAAFHDEVIGVHHQKAMTPAKKYVRSPSMLPITCAKPSSSIPAMSTCIEMVLKA